MKFPKTITVVFAVAIFFVFTSSAFSQNDKPVTIAEILKNAKCPLTDAQVKQLKELDPSQGFQIYRTLFEMFSDDQNEALKKALGTQPGRNDRPDRPRYLFQVIIFENAGCPLTESQLKKLLALPTGQGRGMGGGQAMTEIFTSEQLKVMEQFRGGRGGRRGGNQ